MQIVYAQEEFPEKYKKAIFLAGPTPRDKNVPSWRPEALRILKEQGYDGVVFVPEPRGQERLSDYVGQVEWEREGLERADCIIFWLPRKIIGKFSVLEKIKFLFNNKLPIVTRGMLALTTNVEYGEWFKSGKVVLGAPDDAEKKGYLKYKANKYNVPQSNTLDGTVKHALDVVGDGALRVGGECFVPLHIWNTQSFQSWYSAQKKAGNRVDGAKVEWVFRVNKNLVFFWALKVDIYIKNEDRNKTNEVVIGRYDIASTVVYYSRKKLIDTQIVLIKEFRSPVSNIAGYVWELPGGSVFEGTNDYLELAIEELHEEVGIEIEKNRFQFHGSCQLSSTMSAHKAYLYSVKITKKELDYLSSQKGVAHGVAEDTERTYIEILTYKEIFENESIDYSMKGMIAKVFNDLNK